MSQKSLNSHFANVSLTSKNAAGYSNKKTIGAFHIAGSTKQDAQGEITQVKSHYGYLNLSQVNDLLNSGELESNGFINLLLDENNYFASEPEIKFNLKNKPATLDKSKAAHQGYVSVALKSKNEAGYAKTEIIGNLVKKGSTMPSGKVAFTNFVSINLKKVEELQKAGELANSKYLVFSFFGNKNCEENYSAVQPSVEAKPQMDDIPF